MYSEAVEDYLKAIYELKQDRKPVNTKALSQHLKVTPASVSGMLKKLANETPNLVDYKPHGPILLTRFGEKVALRVIRKHRLLELFLYKVLGYGWDEVHQEAELLEHFISDTMEERIEKYLENPLFDPHGDPIPTKDGTVDEIRTQMLCDIDVGETAKLKRVRIEDRELLRHLDELGIKLDSTLTVRKKDPFNGPITITINNDDNDDTSKTHSIGRWVSEQLLVEQ